MDQKEIIVSREELIQLFNDDLILDTKDGWLFDDMIIQIIALHEKEAKYLNDVTKANFYKLVLLRDLKEEKKLKERL